MENICKPAVLLQRTISRSLSQTGSRNDTALEEPFIRTTDPHPHRIEHNPRKRCFCAIPHRQRGLVALVLIPVIFVIVMVVGMSSFFGIYEAERSPPNKVVFPPGSRYRTIDSFERASEKLSIPRILNREEMSKWKLLPPSTITDYHVYILFPNETFSSLTAGANGDDGIGLRYDATCTIAVLPHSLAVQNDSGVRIAAADPEFGIIYDVTVKILEQPCQQLPMTGLCNLNFTAYDVQGKYAVPFPSNVPCKDEDDTRVSGSITRSCRSSQCDLERPFRSNCCVCYQQATEHYKSCYEVKPK